MNTLRTPLATASDGSPASALAWLGLALMIAPLLTRAISPATTFPHWDLSPLIYAQSAPALSPMGSMLVDGLSILGSSLLMLWAARSGLRLAPLPVALIGLGALGLVLHGWVLGPYGGSLGNQRIGSSWLSALAACAAILHAAQDVRIRRTLLAILLGFAAMLLLRGVVQVFLEHPQTVENFRSNRDRVLAAHGWSPGSPMALGFERRLMQPEASGWFGLSNVYASICAAIGVCGVGLVLVAERARRDGKAGVLPVLALAIVAASGVGGVALANSKGGVIALLIGLAALAVLWTLRRSSARKPHVVEMLAGVLGIFAILGPLAMVVVRGLIGERIGELSILFRWFYMQASVRIFGAHPIFGVGPDGFQQAFLLAKPPLCPEEVTSPHSILLDYLSTLGLFGIALVALVALLAWRAGRNAVVEVQPVPGDRAETRVACVCASASTLAAMFLQTPLIAPETAIVYIGGLVAWCFLAIGGLRVLSHTTHFSLPLSAAAITLLAHAQIEVTASAVASAPLWMIMLALGATTPRTLGASRSARVTVIGCAAACTLLGTGTLLTAALRVRAWERQLLDAANLVRVIPALTDRLNALSTPDGAGDTLEAITRDLSDTLGRNVSTNPVAIAPALSELELRVYPQAASTLERAFDVYPDDRRPLREASSLHARLADSAMRRGDLEQAREHFDHAMSVLRIESSSKQTHVRDPRPNEYSWLALILERQAESLTDSSAWTRAIDARRKAVALDPYNLDNSLRLARALARLGDVGGAREQAAHTLELDDLSRLDRAVKGLSAEQRREVESLASPR